MASRSEERKGEIEWRCLWVYVKTGAIATSGKSSHNLHQMGSFSPSIQMSLTKRKIREGRRRGSSSCL